MPDATEERLRLLEAHVEVQEQLLVAMQAERIEADRLSDSVTRLGDGASALGEALRAVDKQQQMLTKLGQELKEVEDKSVTKEELVEAKREQAHTTLEFRKRTLQRVYTTGILITLGLVFAGGVFLEYQARNQTEAREICQDRNKQAVIIVDILEGSLQNLPPEGQNSPGVINVRNGIERFEALIVDCEKL